MIKRRERKGPTSRQPDFQALFFEHFGPRPKRHRYELRFGTSQMEHDLIFLSSLLHDAKLTIDFVRRRGSRAVIDAERDTWERGAGVEQDWSFLGHCRTRLSISGIQETTWFFEGDPPGRSDELWLMNVDVERGGENGELLNFRLAGVGWDLVFRLVEDDARVALRDVSDAKSHSEK